MKKKNEWMEIRDGRGSKSRIVIKEGIKEGEKNPKIKIINHEKIGISRFDELKDDPNNEAIITLEFVSNRELNEENKEKDVAEYWFTRLKPKDEAERESFEKEAHIAYLTDKGFLNTPKEFGDMTWELKGFDGKINLEIKQTGNSNSSIIKINHEKIKVEFDFFLISKVNIKEVTEYDTITKDPYWTRTKIVIFSLAAIIVLLVIYFRKKIWKWIKGETKQEKKVENQLDIF